MENERGRTPAAPPHAAIAFTLVATLLGIILETAVDRSDVQPTA
jgi:hypothetical protein